MSRRYAVKVTTPRTDGAAPLVAWWYGPDHGWGTTSEAGEYPRAHAASFDSRAAAENALRRVYGSLAAARRRRYSVVIDPRSLPTRKCASCGGRCDWVLDAWHCRSCGDEWSEDHGDEYRVLP